MMMAVVIVIAIRPVDVAQVVGMIVAVMIVIMIVAAVVSAIGSVHMYCGMRRRYRCSFGVGHVFRLLPQNNVPGVPDVPSAPDACSQRAYSRFF